MHYHLRTTHGHTEAVIDDNCGITKFYSIAAILSAELKVKFSNQVDELKDGNTLDWNFRYKNQLITLHYNVFSGVSVLPRQSNNILKENNLVMEIAHFLERRAC